MRARSRYFVVASLLVLVVGVGTGLVAYYAGFPAGFSSQAGLDELRLVPQDASAIAHVDVQQVMASDVWQRINTLFPQQATGRQQFAEHTGINIERDIDWVTVAAVPSSSTPSVPMTGFGLVGGRFDVTKIEMLMSEHGGRAEEYKGVRLLVPGISPQAEHFSVAFIEPTVLAFGSQEMVRRAVDLKDGGAAVTSNEAMMKLVRSFGDRDAWAIGRMDALAAHAPLPPALVGKVPAIDWFAAGVHLNGGIASTLQVETKDLDAAQNLRDVIRGVVALARLQSGSQPALKMALDSLVLGGTERSVSVSLTIPVQLLDLLAGLKNPQDLPELPSK